MLQLLDPASLVLFCTANFLVLIVPGPAVMYTVTRSLSQGRRAGLLSVYGLALGTLPHAMAVRLLMSEPPCCQSDQINTCRAPLVPLIDVPVTPIPAALANDHEVEYWHGQ